MKEAEHERDRAAAEELFVEWVARREAGEEVDLDRLCCDRLELVPLVRALTRRASRLADGLAQAAGVDAGPRAGSDSSTIGERATQPAGLDTSDELLDRLLARGSTGERYEIQGIVGVGGMGEVHEVWDGDLRRSIAMKLLRADRGGPDRERRLARFLEEAQVMGQLDHPAIVPVHELGLDAQGRVYFTMKLVEGRTLREVFRRVEQGDPEWSRTRAVSVLSSVAEAMAYAHERGVVHRDLKPENVLVGRFGEVYVVDWGLARVEGEVDRRDLRLSEAPPAALDTSRSTSPAPEGSSLYTQDGDVLGTPAYMAPEQALGKIDQVGPRADIYSFGAMLYHLLAGRRPYQLPGEASDNFTTWRRVTNGPPSSLHEVAPNAPLELVSIAEHAMRRDPNERYESMKAVAADLRAWLEGRVVAAHEGGAWAELRKWIRRNRALASAIGAALVFLIGGLAASSVLSRRAEKRAGEVLRLAALQDLAELGSRADALWPIRPDQRQAYEDWVRDALALLATRSEHDRTLKALRSRGRRRSPAEIEAILATDTGYWKVESARQASERARRTLELREQALSTESASVEQAGLEEARRTSRNLERALLREQARLLRPREWEFDSLQDQWWHDQLVELTRGCDDLADPEHGLLDGVSPEHGWGVRRRLRMLDQLEHETLTGTQARRLWSEASASIADLEHCPLYEGLSIDPQFGLLPLGRNPDSGLWEFCDLQTGEPPQRDPTSGELYIEVQSGMALVLIPGGIYLTGAQATDPASRHYDPWTERPAGPVVERALDPYFVGKHEMTQAQWERATGRNPSFHNLDFMRLMGQPYDPRLPVEYVSHLDARRCLRRLGFDLPTEAQWEAAARGGSDTPWWMGPDPSWVHPISNLLDPPLAETYQLVGDLPDYDDGYVYTAPVDLLVPNPFGLFGVHGNVEEWCRDHFSQPLQPDARAKDGESLDVTSPMRAGRGGSCLLGPKDARITQRMRYPEETRMTHLGLRPVRVVD